ncbi:DUF1127 domain-containing protein [Pseudomonas mucidolens]|nr:DUF1127 domain-containing protein [Pseudomonas mucidolens]
MSGLNDVRLVLQSQELEAGQQRTTAGLAPRVTSGWSLFWRRRQTRKALLELTQEQLRDIGLDTEQARQEGLKPFWRG